MELWNRGETLARISLVMRDAGYDLSRSAIAGRKHRLSAGKPVERRVRLNRPKKGKPQRSKTVDNRVNWKKPPPPPVVDTFDLSTWSGIEYLKLREDGCKAIMDGRGADGLPLVCGRHRGVDLKGNRSPYCSAHIRLYFTQPKPGGTTRSASSG
jgi:hypothetical protein